MRIVIVADRQFCKSPLPIGAEETYEAFKDNIFNDSHCEEKSASNAFEMLSNTLHALTTSNSLIVPSSEHPVDIVEHIMEVDTENLEKPVTDNALSIISYFSPESTI